LTGTQYRKCQFPPYTCGTPCDKPDFGWIHKFQLYKISD